MTFDVGCVTVGVSVEVDDHGLMVAVFRQTDESLVMKNFLSFLHKSKSVSIPYRHASLSLCRRVTSRDV